ncbi:hypothetical protein Vretifemale_7740 [Volvox reticuliferus]|nr:hypothetical protein Vretifemale_7740 [Volvox reticuliferus]
MATYYSFSLCHPSIPQVWSNSQMGLTDGGRTDITSLYPALRRRVTNVVALSSARLPTGLPRRCSETESSWKRLRTVAMTTMMMGMSTRRKPLMGPIAGTAADPQVLHGVCQTTYIQSLHTGQRVPRSPNGGVA